MKNDLDYIKEILAAALLIELINVQSERMVSQVAGAGRELQWASGHPWHWHIGWCEDEDTSTYDETILDTYDDARERLAEELAFRAGWAEAVAVSHDCDDFATCPTYGDSCPWNLAQDLRFERDEMLADEDSDFALKIGGCHFWLFPCGYDVERDFCHVAPWQYHPLRGRWARLGEGLTGIGRAYPPG